MEAGLLRNVLQSIRKVQQRLFAMESKLNPNPIEGSLFNQLYPLDDEATLATRTLEYAQLLLRNINVSMGKLEYKLQQCERVINYDRAQTTLQGIQMHEVEEWLRHPANVQALEAWEKAQQ